MEKCKVYNVSCEEYVIENGVLTFIAVNSEHLVIPEGVEEIESLAVKDNRDRIRELTLPSTLRFIRRKSFSGCKNLERIYFSEGLLEIGVCAFSDCSALKRFDLPESLRKIRVFAFERCCNLEEVVIPAGVAEIEYGVFNHCGLRSVVLQENLQVLEGGAFSECTRLESVVLPLTLSKIPEYTFQGCASLKRLELPETLLEIGYRAFKGCAALDDVSLPGRLQKIDKSAFAGCKAIRQVTIPDDIGEIPDGTFSGCTQLRRIVLPERLRYISRFAFCGCENLEYVECMNPERFEDALLGTPFWSKYRPGSVIPAGFPMNLGGSYSGEFLRELGYMFFDPRRRYTIERPGEDGVVEVNSWSSEDPPDEDGYGMEDYYDWWYLDESLQEIPGVSMFPDYSYRDKRNSWKRFSEERAKAAEEIRRRKH